MDSNPNSRRADAEPPPLPTVSGNRPWRIFGIVGAAFAFVAIMGAGVVFGVRAVQDRRPGAAIVLRFDLSSLAVQPRAETWMSIRRSIQRRAGVLGGCRVSEAGPERLRVRFPGRQAAEIAPVAAVLVRRGELQLRPVHPQLAYLEDRPTGRNVPEGYEILPLRPADGGAPRTTYFAVRCATPQTAFAVDDARPTMDVRGRYEILIKFSDESGRRFAELTGATVGRCLAIVVDGELYSAPRVNERVSGGSAQITGTFTQREAIELAERLASALPIAAEAALENPDGSPAAGAVHD